jgi:excisionase family DNA binding protein
MHTSAHTLVHMSPAQAAQVCGVSRWTIIRAIKNNSLNAIRDNKNNWKISKDSLDLWWSAHSAHTVHEPMTAHDESPTEAIVELKQMLAVEVARTAAAERARDQAEADRDQWREMSKKLQTLLENAQNKGFWGRVWRR